MNAIIKLSLAVSLLLPTGLAAQNYSLDWFTIDNGGGTSTGGVFTVAGTIGQPDAGAMSGGNFTLQGGFWSLVSVVQMPGVPNLLVARSGSSVVVSWPNTGSFTLQQSDSLAGGSWLASGYAITLANGTNSITVTNPVGNLFFRLKQ